MHRRSGRARPAAAPGPRAARGASRGGCRWPTWRTNVATSRPSSTMARRYGPSPRARRCRGGSSRRAGRPRRRRAAATSHSSTRPSKLAQHEHVVARDEQGGPGVARRFLVFARSSVIDMVNRSPSGRKKITDCWGRPSRAQRGEQGVAAAAGEGEGGSRFMPALTAAARPAAGPPPSSPSYAVPARVGRGPPHRPTSRR